MYTFPIQVPIILIHYRITAISLPYPGLNHDWKGPDTSFPLVLHKDGVLSDLEVHFVLPGQHLIQKSKTAEAFMFFFYYLQWSYLQQVYATQSQWSSILIKTLCFLSLFYTYWESAKKSKGWVYSRMFSTAWLSLVLLSQTSAASPLGKENLSQILLPNPSPETRTSPTINKPLLLTLGVKMF